ncbi:hypothetical protein PR048_026301 [Dryococelus australis]|uniref:Uncharacterized protein n=1 Tax=Dryococelus australis TaxID=614101 RepID=A0ABQ9GKY4_9NEOP|nr:hypothetical protein PR048_026301 [Dryococelus australis]
MCALATGDMACNTVDGWVVLVRSRVCLRTISAGLTVRERCVVARPRSRSEGSDTGENPRENPHTCGIVGHDSHLRKSGVTRSGIEPAGVGSDDLVRGHHQTIPLKSTAGGRNVVQFWNAENVFAQLGCSLHHIFCPRPEQVRLLRVVDGRHVFGRRAFNRDGDPVTAFDRADMFISFDRPLAGDGGTLVWRPSGNVYSIDPSDRRRADREATSRREIYDCEYQAVKSAAGRLDIGLDATGAHVREHKKEGISGARKCLRAGFCARRTWNGVVKRTPHQPFSGDRRIGGWERAQVSRPPSAGGPGGRALPPPLPNPGENCEAMGMSGRVEPGSRAGGVGHILACARPVYPVSLANCFSTSHFTPSPWCSTVFPSSCDAVPFSNGAITPNCPLPTAPREGGRILRNGARAGEYEAASECKGGGNGKTTEKTHRPAASFGMIPTCDNSGTTPPGIEFGSPGGGGGEFSNHYTTAAPTTTRKFLRENPEVISPPASGEQRICLIVHANHIEVIDDGVATAYLLHVYQSDVIIRVGPWADILSATRGWWTSAHYKGFSSNRLGILTSAFFAPDALPAKRIRLFAPGRRDRRLRRAKATPIVYTFSSSHVSPPLKVTWPGGSLVWDRFLARTRTGFVIRRGPLSTAPRFPSHTVGHIVAGATPIHLLLVLYVCSRYYSSIDGRSFPPPPPVQYKTSSRPHATRVYCTLGSHVEGGPDDAAGGRVFSGIARFSRPCIAVLLSLRLVSPSPALETSLLKDVQISPLPSNHARILCALSFTCDFCNFARGTGSNRLAPDRDDYPRYGCARRACITPQAPRGGPLSASAQLVPGNALLPLEILKAPPHLLNTFPATIHVLIPRGKQKFSASNILRPKGVGEGGGGCRGIDNAPWGKGRVMVADHLPRHFQGEGFLCPRLKGVGYLAVETRCSTRSTTETLHASSARRSAGASGVRVNVVLIGPALPFLKRAKNIQVGGALKIEMCERAYAGVPMKHCTITAISYDYLLHRRWLSPRIPPARPLRLWSHRNGEEKIGWPALRRDQLEPGELPSAVLIKFDDPAITTNQRLQTALLNNSSGTLTKELAVQNRCSWAGDRSGAAFDRGIRSGIGCSRVVSGLSRLYDSGVKESSVYLPLFPAFEVKEGDIVARINSGGIGRRVIKESLNDRRAMILSGFEAIKACRCAFFHMAP